MKTLFFIAELVIAVFVAVSGARHDVFIPGWDNNIAAVLVAWSALHWLLLLMAAVFLFAENNRGIITYLRWGGWITAAAAAATLAASWI